MKPSKIRKSIKRSVNPILAKFGYQIKNRAIVNQQYDALTSENKGLKALRKQSIEEIEGLYREFVFAEFPAHAEQRTELMAELLGTNISEAMYLVHYLHKSLTLPGDVCEFGVAQGTTSALLAHEIWNTNKHLWLFDSFEGLPKPSEKDILKDDIAGLGSIEAYEGVMDCDVSAVQQSLRNIAFPAARTRIVPGFIEQTINRPHLPAEVCFAYVDFDFYEPILTALNFLDKVLQPGGFIMVDDYDFFSTGAKTAVDEFVGTHQKNYCFSLPIQSAGHFCLLEKLV